jgi:hypothetical protein
MRRFIAASLLSVLLAALLAPAAAATPIAPPAHACCLRSQQHHCNGDANGNSDSSVEHDHSYLRAARGCCSQPVRALATSAPDSAPLHAVSFAIARDPHLYLTDFVPAFATADAAARRHERAPPTHLTL